MENQWNNITLSEFKQIRAVFADEAKNELDKMVSIAAILQGVDEETINQMPLDEVQPIFAMAWGLNKPPKRSRIRSLYQVGGWKLKVTPLQDISVAQWVDYQNFLRGDLENNMVDLLSVALVPLGKTYNEGYDIAELKRALEQQMYVPDALAVCFFFQRKYLKSMRRTLTALVGWMITRKPKTKEALEALRIAKKEALKVRREVSAMMRSL